MYFPCPVLRIGTLSQYVACRRLIKAALRTMVVLIIRPLVLFVVTGAFISLIRQLPSLMYELYVLCLSDSVRYVTAPNSVGSCGLSRTIENDFRIRASEWGAELADE